MLNLPNVYFSPQLIHIIVVVVLSLFSWLISPSFWTCTSLLFSRTLHIWICQLIATSLKYAYFVPCLLEPALTYSLSCGIVF